MREFDTDSDGKLSFTEFQVSVNSNAMTLETLIFSSVGTKFIFLQRAVEKLKERESQG